jgi:L-ascorbate metabolism protein UlaG (beta-lactamase superfamily)
MGAATAALAVKRFLNVETVIPCHYGTFGIIDQTADKFVAELKGHATKVIVAEKGQAFGV